jgi:hypothetical protein
MAMLAEPKSKQKWSLDPRNINWSSGNCLEFLIAVKFLKSGAFF